MSLLALSVIVVAGTCIGLLTPEGRRGVLPLLGSAALFGLVALVLLSFCDRLTFLDMLFLNYVSDKSCLLGGFESNELGLAYAFVVATIVVGARTTFTRRSTSA